MRKTLANGVLSKPPGQAPSAKDAVSYVHREATLQARKPIKLRYGDPCVGIASAVVWASQWTQHQVGGEILRTIQMMPCPCYNEKKAQHMNRKPSVDSTRLPAEYAPTLLQAGFVL